MNNVKTVFRSVFLPLCFFFSICLPSFSAPSGHSVWLDFLRLGDIDQAIEDFQHTIQSTPDDYLAYAGLAMLSSSRNTDIDPATQLLLAVEHGRNHPEAVLFLTEAVKLVAGRDECEEALNTLQTIEQQDNLPSYLLSRLQFAKGLLFQKLGKWEEAKKAFATQNFITSFWVCGPFDNAEKGGHDMAFPPETDLSLTTVYKGKRGDVGWRKITVQPYDGYINLHSLVAPSKESSAYLVTQIESSQEQRCKLQFGHAGALKVWLNGRLQADVTRYHKAMPDQVIVSSTLKQGLNTILLKVSSSETSKFGLFARLLPAETDSVQIVELDKDRSEITSATPGSSQKIESSSLVEPVSLQQLKALVEGPDSKPYQFIFYALLLNSLNVADEFDNTANALLSDLNNNIPNNPLVLRYLGDSEKQTNRQRLAYIKALEIDPNDQACFIRLLKYYQKSPYATTFLDLLRGWEKSNELPASARLLQARVLAGKGLREAAVDIVRAVMEDDPSLETRTVLYDIGHPIFTESQNRDLLQKILNDNHTNGNALHALRTMALRDGNREAVENYLAQEQWLSPFSISGFVEMAKHYQARGEYQKSRHSLSQALAVSPDDFECHRLSAIAYNMLGDIENALAELNRALVIQPSDPWCLEYQEFLKPHEENYASPYRKRWEDLSIPDALDLSKANYVTLLDQCIVKVHQNGNSSETVHIATKILTDNGMQQKQAHGIYYEAETEEVRIIRARVWKPDGTFYDAPAPQRRSTASASDAASKLYGDYSVAILRFPALEKNAVIELEYEKKKKGENLYADYFGDIFYAGDTSYEPTALAEYVLITPVSRDFYWKFIPPHYPESVSTDALELGEQPSIQSSAAEKVYHWTFKNMPTIPREPYMPNYTEILPYVKVSTFQTWQDMTTWYWNLIKDQLIPGQPVKERLAQVLQDYREKMGYDIEKELSDFEKVRAINEYVNTDVRYLGLEFGIHGYKPHKVDEICNARYGDCKDKASLAIAMLKEVGIEAHFVIIRTSHLGEIDYDLPSLGIFNHAIYYLPDIDGKEYWIDGTATFYDATELPSGDEGSNTLIVQPGGQSSFKRVPFSAAEANGAVFTTVLKLDNEGNAAGYRSSEFRGLYNPIVRRTYENPVKAKEIVDRILVSSYPGSRTWNIELSDLNDYATSERLSYELEVSQFAVKRDDALVLPSTLFVDQLSQRYAHLSEREYEMVLSYRWNRSNILKIIVPDGYGNIQLPGMKNVKTEFGTYTRTCEINDGAIEIKEDLLFNAIRVPKEMYTEFREFCRLVDLYQSEKVTVKREG
jgi:cellulose synthase operon protein C